MQTAVGKVVVEKLSDMLDGEISFEKIHLKPFTTLIVKDITIIDKQPYSDPEKGFVPPVDTFFHADYIIAKFSLESLLGHEGVHIDKAVVTDAFMNLVIEDVPGAVTDTNTVNLMRIFKIIPEKDKVFPEKEIFLIRNVQVRNMAFAMKNYTSDRPEVPKGGIDWNDLDVNDINVTGKDLRFKAGVMSARNGHVSFRERTGLTCNDISAKDIKVGNGKTIIKNLTYEDGMSSLDLPIFMMSYTCPEDFSDFINKVKLDGEVVSSTVDFRTISYFAPQLKGNCLRLSVEGKLSGEVCDFDVSGVKVASEAGGFSGTIEGNMSGLPDIERTRLDMKARNFNVTAKGLGLFISEWMHEGQLDLRNYAPGTIFMLKADAKGLLNKLRIKADMYSLTGRLTADATLKDVADTTRPIGISGTLNTMDLDVGRIIRNDLIHQTTLRTGLSVELAEEGIQMKLDSLIVDRLNVNKYDYSGIAAAGELNREHFNGKIICNDPNLNFLFQGSFALSSKTNDAVYRFYANIGQADLKAMNIDKRGKSKIRLQTNANFRRTAKGQMFGKVDIGNIILENSMGKHEIGDISISSNSVEDQYKIKVNSLFADASYSGTAPVGQFARDLTNITLKKELPAMFRDSLWTWKGNNYDASINFHNSIGLLAFLAPGFYIAEGTQIGASISTDGLFDMKMNSPRLAFKEQYFKDIQVEINNREEVFSGSVLCDEISAAGLTLKDNNFMILSDNNHIGLGYTYENQGDRVNRGEFFIHGDLSREDDQLEIGIGLLPSTLYLNSKQWNIQSSQATIRGMEITVPSVEFTSGEEAIRLSGGTSRMLRDTLTLSLERFDISMLNAIIGEKFGLKGAATGKVMLTSPLENVGLIGEILCDSTYISGRPVGIMNITSVWNEEFQRFDIGLKNSLDGKSSVSLEGNFSPKHKLLNAQAVFDRFDVGYISPLTQEIFSEMAGELSGKILLDGPISSLGIASEDTRLDGGQLRIGYTNVPYNVDGGFHIDSEGVWFDDISVRDRYDGRGKVSGSINWDYFRDIRFDTSVNVNQMECVDIDEKQAEYFYGQVFANGKVHIGGPLEALVLSVDATTTKPGQLHIPISGIDTSQGTTDLLQFKQPYIEVKIDPYEDMLRKLRQKKKSDSNFGVNLRVNATQDVEAFIEIDKASGNVLSGKGNGLINLEVGTDVFSIKGDYRLSSGKYKFSAMNLVNRDFLIQDGSTINFTGDIMDSRLDIDAIYRTKASLSTLISDTSSVSNRRNVECGIKISDKISSPKISFSINVPDLDPTVKSRVESALSTEDKVQKQFLSLMIMNNFLPDDQSGIVNNMYGNVGDLMMNQINNIFQKLDIPVDLGLKYQPNDKGTDIFDVAVSTQLFNNRVVVNGNIGNKATGSGSSQNGVAGDIEIEIKLDRPGSFRLNLFSHSADQYTNTLDNSQRSGVGLTYQTEFNTIGQFVRKMFSSKEKRQQLKMEEEMQVLDGEKTVLSITKDDSSRQRKKDRH